METDSLKKMCIITSSEQPGAAEALMVFAAVQGKAGYLAGLAKGTWMEDGYAQVAAALEAYPGTVEEWLQTDEAPSRYRKVWRAYLAEKVAIDNDRRIIGLMRGKTLDALRASGTTVYRVCRDLGLNEGNVYAYLNKGDVTKVSKATASRIMDYALGN